MRVTQSSLLSESLRQIRLNSSSFARAQVEAGTGLRLQSASDDPVAAQRVLSIDSQLADLDRYHRAMASARTLLGSQDAALTSARDLMAKARDLARSVASSAPGDPLRASVAAQIQQIRSSVMALADTQVNTRYVFAGSNPGGVAPFTGNNPYAGDSGTIGVEIDRGVVIATTTPGEPLFGDALRSLSAMATEVASGDQASINAAISSGDTASTGMLEAQTMIGGRLAQSDATDQRGATLTSQLKSERDALVSVDPAEAGVRLTAAQSALERAYAAVSKMLSTDLLSYLK